MLKNKWFKFSLVLFLLPLVCILVTYNKLPAQVATHFDFHGTPDGYMNKFLGLYGVWGFMLVLHIFCAFMTFNLPKIRRNYTIGIRTSWALNSDENWSRTHRFSGYVFVLSGMLYIIFSLLGYMFIGLGIILISSLLCFGYSYSLYKKGI